MISAQSGGHIVHDVGYLESGLCYSLAQLVICDEILSWLGSSMREVDISDEALAVDLIDQIGPDGQYLDHMHTATRFRERWYPELFKRDTYDNWAAKGSTTLGQRAAKRVEEILEGHQPEPLPGEVTRRIKEIVARAERSSRGA